MKQSLMIYGAYGYTGRLMVGLAAQYGLQPILAGRDAARLEPLAQAHGFAWRCFDLSSAHSLDEALRDVRVIIHAAGPFVFTARPMLEACLRTGTHYLDITGETDVFAMAASLDQAARTAGIMLMPGTGFDVVPTDCLALALQQRLPDATHLQLAFGGRGGGGISHGTATSMVNKLGTGGAIRQNGKLVPKPLGHEKLEVEVDGTHMFTMAIPWGDIVTAWHTTGIPNIITYTRVKPAMYQLLKWQWLFNGLLRTRLVKQWIQRKIDQRPAGPSDAQRLAGSTCLWGRARNQAGQSVTASFTTPEAYTLTAHASLHIARLVLAENWKPGYHTPAGCYGPSLVFDLPGVSALQWR